MPGSPTPWPTTGRPTRANRCAAGSDPRRLPSSPRPTTEGRCASGEDDPVPTCFSDKPTLTGDLVVLRPVSASDVEVLARIIAHDDEVARLTGSVHFSDERAPA